MTSLPANKETQKQLGAWYTPPEIVRVLVDWAVRSPDTRVLDPAVGDGDFLLKAAERLISLGRRDPDGLLFGVDVSAEAVSATADALSAVGGPAARLLVRDFFELDAPGLWPSELPSVQAVVGNPPYVRYQRFAGRTRTVAVGRARDAGVRLSRLSSSWAAFVIHATSFLSSGGRLALVLPEELVHSAYAASVRAFLRHTFESTAVIGFDGYLFPRSQERVVLVLAEGKGLSQAGQLRLASVSHPNDLADLDCVLRSSEAFGASEYPEKWHVGATDTATDLLDQLVGAGRLVPLRALGKPGIGYVSGANDYFVLRPSEARRRGFPDEVLSPTVVAARQVPGAQLTPADFAAASSRDEPCLLWTGGGSDNEAVARYIREGHERGIPERYKCRMREPWHVVPGVVVPDALLTYMSHQVPRLVLNGAGATCSNNLLCIRVDSLKPTEMRGVVTSFYNSATMLSAERIGRHYGGGVLKLEPSEAGRILVPSLSPAELVSLSPLLGDVDRHLRAGKAREALALIDEVVLRRFMGLDMSDIAVIQHSWARRQRSRAGVRLSLPLSERGMQRALAAHV